MEVKGEWIVSGSDDTNMKGSQFYASCLFVVWKMNGETVHTLKGHSDFINCLDFDIEGTRGIIVSGSRDYSIR